MLSECFASALIFSVNKYTLVLWRSWNGLSKKYFSFCSRQPIQLPKWTCVEHRLHWMQLSSPLRWILSGKQPFPSYLSISLHETFCISVLVIGLVRMASATLVFSIINLLPCLLLIVPLPTLDTDARWDLLGNFKLSIDKCCPAGAGVVCFFLVLDV